MSYSLEALGRVIRDAREGAGLTQDQLGAQAGYGAGAGVSISRVERGLTRPSAGSLAGIALALESTPEQLEMQATSETKDGAGLADNEDQASEETLKKRVKRLEGELNRRTELIEAVVRDFNEAHDRARDAFFVPFLELASSIEGAPLPDEDLLEDEDIEQGSAGPGSRAAFRLRVNRFGVAQALAHGAGGAAVGAAAGGGAAYGTFMAAVSFGTASTGAAISGLSGVAASNAALAALGGGTLAAGGLGVAGGTLLLTGMVATPVVLLAIGGLFVARKRSRRQREEAAATLREVETNIQTTQRGFDALTDFLPRATTILTDIAVHAARAASRWNTQLEAAEHQKPWKWEAMAEDAQDRYNDFVEVSALQLSVVSLNAEELMASSGAERELLIEEWDSVLTQARQRLDALV